MSEACVRTGLVKKSVSMLFRVKRSAAYIENRSIIKQLTCAGSASSSGRYASSGNRGGTPT